MRKREHYIVDGYNVIHAWPELNALQSDLAHARDRLIHILSEYGAYERYDITIVFDALLTEDEERREKMGPHLEIIYTGAGETADSCIERMAYESVRRGREVHVVSSDGAIESVILGAGAYRHPSLEFRRAVRKAKKHLREEYLGQVRLPLARYDVGERLDPATAAKLDLLRKQKNKKFFSKCLPAGRNSGTGCRIHLYPEFTKKEGGVHGRKRNQVSRPEGVPDLQRGDEKRVALWFLPEAGDLWRSGSAGAYLHL